MGNQQFFDIKNFAKNLVNDAIRFAEVHSMPLFNNRYSRMYQNQHYDLDASKKLAENFIIFELEDFFENNYKELAKFVSNPPTPTTALIYQLNNPELLVPNQNFVEVLKRMLTNPNRAS